MNDDEAIPCPQCVKGKRSAASWRHAGECCGHVECPNRRPVTAGPGDTNGRPRLTDEHLPPDER